jgi:hypothetical protein
MSTSKREKRRKPDSDERTKTTPDDSLLTPSATAASPSDRCWKCKGKGLKFQKSTQSYDGPPCKVCSGIGSRKRSKRSKVLASAPGKILNLRGYPEDHSLRKIYPDGFSGPRAVWGSAAGSRHLRRHHLGNGCGGSRSGGGDNEYNNDSQNTYDDLPNNLRPHEGEIVSSLGCGDWRIYQIADGNKLTVDDFVCAWVAAEEMRKRGYGAHLHRENATIKDCDDDNRCDDGKMFGGRIVNHLKDDQPDGTHQSNFAENNGHRFNHADIGTGCGSVLMMIAWAFLGEIQSIGVEAQSISFNCLQRGLEWNLGRDGTFSKDVVQIRQNDLRTWDGCGVNDLEVSKVGTTATTTPIGDGKNDQSPGLRAPYRLITGTPPYFPLDSFVASQNHEQKVRCRVPTRGGAPDYIEAASRFLMEEKFDKKIEGGETVNGVDKHSPIETSSEGVFCMVEAAFDKAEANVLDAAKKFNMRVRRRVDVVTRFGLPPRFSCWVMTKKNTSKTNEGASTTAFNDGRSSKEAANKKAEKKEEKNNDDCDSFPIEIFTLRNADLTRTKEYTNAMEIMGWVDFEKSKRKIKKSLKEMI